jgi:hypothetical protein
LAISCSITHSRLLITSVLSARKHQLGDFFNTNSPYHSLNPAQP